MRLILLKNSAHESLRPTCSGQASVRATKYGANAAVRRVFQQYLQLAAIHRAADPCAEPDGAGHRGIPPPPPEPQDHGPAASWIVDEETWRRYCIIGKPQRQRPSSHNQHPQSATATMAITWSGPKIGWNPCENPPTSPWPVCADTGLAYARSVKQSNVRDRCAFKLLLHSREN